MRLISTIRRHYRSSELRMTLLKSTFWCHFIAGLTASAVTAQTIAEPEEESLFSGEIGVTVVNQYMTRGFVVQGEGTSFQPHFDLVATLYQGEGFINNASAFIGLWAV